MPKVNLLETADGSYSLYRADIDETYHSRHGAKQESEHVFIKTGLNYFLNKWPEKEAVSVFEVGFGTGLNFFLTLNSFPKSKQLYYHGVEKFPLDKNIHKNWLQQSTFLQSSLFDKWIDAPWNDIITQENISLLKDECDFLIKDNFKAIYDVIYMDAFGFRAQEEMWTDDVCQKLFQLCATNGVLVTYCAKGVVRRSLQKVGFICERLPGPPGKREMLRAVKP